MNRRNNYKKKYTCNIIREKGKNHSTARGKVINISTTLWTAEILRNKILQRVNI
jgi:hypothetical protein